MSQKRNKYQDEASGAHNFPTIVFAMCKEDKDAWLSKAENDGLSAMMHKKVHAVRVHSEKRKNCYKHPRYSNCSRLTVMLTENGSVNLKDEHTANNRNNTEPFIGLTVFYTSLPSGKEATRTAFLDTRQGLVKQEMTFQEWEDTKQVYYECAHPRQVFELKLKGQ